MLLPLCVLWSLWLVLDRTVAGPGTWPAAARGCSGLAAATSDGMHALTRALVRALEESSYEGMWIMDCTFLRPPCAWVKVQQLLAAHPGGRRGP